MHKNDHSSETVNQQDQHPLVGPTGAYGPTERFSQSDGMEENACIETDVDIQAMIEKNSTLYRTRRDKARCENWFSHGYWPVCPVKKIHEET